MLTMLRALMLFFFLFVHTCPTSLAEGDPFAENFAESTSSGGLKVLFIGNSLLYVGELPEVFVALVRAQNSQASLKVMEVGGDNYSLGDHIKGNLAQQAIQMQGPWDFVILQEQSSKAYNSPESCYADAKTLDAIVRAARARPITFEAWSGLSDSDYYWSHDACKKIAQVTHEDVVPIATALMYAHQYKIKTDLLAKDDHHLGNGGLYLAACVLYAKLLRRSPEGLPSRLYGTSEARKGKVVVDLPVEQTRQLQNIAWRTVCAPWK